ncbi:Ig-like domain-containing protein, partial [Urechidicola vernalis]
MSKNYFKNIPFRFISTFLNSWRILFIFLFFTGLQTVQSQEIIASQYFNEDLGVISVSYDTIPVSSGFVGVKSVNDNWAFTGVAVDGEISTSNEKVASDPYSLKIQNFGNNGTDNHLVYFRTVDISEYDNVRFSIGFASDGEQRQHDDLRILYNYYIDADGEGVEDGVFEWVSFTTRLVIGTNNTPIDFGQEVPTVTEPNPYITPIGAIPNGATKFNVALISINSSTSGGSGKPKAYYIDDVELTGSAPEISVFGNNNLIENGQTETSTINNTDFGNAIANEATKLFEYSINNSGDLDLELTGAPLPVSITGDTDDFLLTVNPVTPVLPDDSSTFTIAFQPKSLGEKSITVTIANSDLDENPYTFVVIGTGTDAEFQYCDPTTPPIPNDNSSFYLSNVAVGDIDNTSTFEDPDRYSYFTQFTTNLNREQSYFTSIKNSTLDNSDSGVGIWIDYNRDGDFEDANEEVYTNLYSAGSGETEVERTLSILIPKFASPGLTRMRITVQEGEIPTPCGPFNQTGEVEDYDVTIVDLTDASPNALLLGNGIPIADGSNSTELENNTNFGRKEILADPQTNGFLIANLGGLDLTLDDPSPHVEITGDIEDFIISLVPSTPIIPASGSRFEITFNPQSEGIKSAVVSIAMNDSEKDPYTFAIEGVGFIPKARIITLGEGIFIQNGDITPREADNTDFRNIEVNGTALEHTFSIVNEGEIDLLLYDDPIIQLANDANFILTSPPASSVSPSDGTTFSVVFDPIEPGQHTTTVSIANNDEDQHPYIFDITGFGIIDTYCGVLDTINIPPSLSYYISNVTTDVIDNTTLFEPGRYSYYPGTIPDYTLGNTYNMSLTIETETDEEIGTAVWIDYNNDGDFLDFNEKIYTDLTTGSTNTTIERSFDFTIPEDAVEVITRMRIAVEKGEIPLACGPFISSGEIEDYLVNIVPITEPKTEIELVGNGEIIFNGDATPNTNDDTYFGSIDIDLGIESHTFTINNKGDLDLLLNGNPIVSLIGDTDSFSLSSLPEEVISGGGNTTFSIDFDPFEAREKTVIVEISNNDLNENPYRFAIQGNGKISNDNDGDLVLDQIDLDNDNDGIPNVEENSDCSNLVFKNTITLLEDFGTQSLDVGTPSVSSPYLGSYEYLPLAVGSVPEDSENSLIGGKYSVFNSIQEASSWADRSWHSLGDHTNGGTAPTGGRMLLINTNQVLNSEYYRRDIAAVEIGTPVDVSFWVLNLDLDIPDNEGRILPNMEVIIEQGNTSYTIISTGDVPRESLGDTAAWKNFSGSFIPESSEPITIVIVDRAALGNGNEFAIDDISVSQTQGICDIDGDGIPNEFDLDSDNDGIYDVIEAGGVDANNNGLADDDDDNSDNTATGGIPLSAGEGLVPTTTEGAHADYIDFDSDEDGCTDANEAYNSITTDPDNDGMFGEGIPTILDNGTVADAFYISPADGDENTVPDFVQLSETIVDIVRSPFDAIVLEGINVIFSVEVDFQGEGAGVRYQWQEDKGDGFEDLANDGKYEGVNSPLIRILNVDYSMSGYKYRVLVESPSYVCDDDLISAEAELIIKSSNLVTEKMVDNINPYANEDLNYTITVSNFGPQDATSVSVVDILPPEVTFISDNSNGSYNPVDGVWNIGNLSVGSSTSLIITVNVNTNAVGTVRNEIVQVNLAELDLITEGDVLYADFIVNTVPMAFDDTATVAEDSGTTSIDVTANDNFGDDGASIGTIAVVSGSSDEGGTVIVNDNKTPTDPTDDLIDYTPATDFNGEDRFEYRITDSNGDISNAIVNVTVTSVDDFPEATDDTLVEILEDAIDAQITVLVNDDFGGDGPGTMILETPPANGIAVIDDQGNTNVLDDLFLYTPSPDYNGSDSFTYTITDSDGDASTATVTIKVTPVNDEPVATDDTVEADEDTPLNIDVLANDDFGGDGPSSGPIEVSSPSTSRGGTVVVNTNGTDTDPTDDTIDYTPAKDFNGTDSFDYNILDVDGNISPATVTIVVNPINDLPVAEDDEIKILEDDPATLILVAYNDDFGGDGPSDTPIVIFEAPTNGTAIIYPGTTPNDPTDDSILYTPDANYFGTDMVVYTIEDSNGDSSNATLTITIESVDDEPMAVDDETTVAEDSGVTNIDVTDNDDFGGDGPSTGTISVIEGSTQEGGTVSVNDNGSSDDPTDDLINYEPALDFYGTDTFDYKILDSDGDDSVATVTVTVTSVNDVPRAMDDVNVLIVEDRIEAELFILNNDEFGGDGPGTFTLTSLPANGTATIDDRGTPDVLDDVAVYSPTPDYNGPDSFTYAITDSDGDPSTASVSIEVTPVDDFPLAEDDTVETDEDTPLNIDVLANDDFGGDGPSIVPIEVSSPSTSKGGTVVVNTNGTDADPTDDTIDYVPALDFNGTDTFDYNILDDDGDVSPATVTITVNSVNDLPIAKDIPFSILEDAIETTIPVTYNDDFGGDGPSSTPIVIATAPTNGVASVDDNLTPTDPTDDNIVYMPNANYNGIDTVVYTIEDSNGDKSNATLTITIESVDDLPIASDDAVTVAEDSGVTSIDVTANDDFGGDGPSVGTISVVSGSTGEGGAVVVNDNGTPNDPTDDLVDYEPKLDFFGTDTFDYKILDADGDDSVATVTVTVTSVNDVPMAVDDPNVVIVEDRINAVLYLLPNDDFGGDGPGTFTLTSLPPNGTATIDDQGNTNVLDDVVVYSPTPDYNGSDSFTYTITDSDGDASTATVTIELTPVNDEPLAEDDATTTDEDTALNIDVLPNDDFGGDGPSLGPIEVTSASTAMGGTVVVNENGTTTDPTDDTIDYVPALDFNGTDTFDYNILDVDGDISSARVTITVNSVNDVPIAQDVPSSILEDASATTIPVTYNDDFGGDGPSSTPIVIATVPTNGVATVDDNLTPTDPTDDSIVYTPNANYNGTDTVVYTIEDSNGDTSNATVTITIESVNDLPTANADTVTVTEDSGVTSIDVTANDDFGGDGPSVGTISVVSGSTVEGGTVVVNDNGTPNDPTDDLVAYQPKLDFYGSDTFDYKILDADGDDSVATVTVTVTSVNDVPTAVGDIASVAENSSGTLITVLSNDDFGGDGPSASAITIAAPPVNGVAVVNDNGTPNDPTDDTLFYAPNSSYDGVDVIQYTIADAEGDTATASVIIRIFPVDVDPVASDDFAQVNEDNSNNTIDVLQNDSFGGNGPGIGPIEITSSAPTAMGATISVNENGTPDDPTDDSIIYTPSPDFNGIDSFSYSIKDSDNDTASAIVTVNVLQVNDLPTANDDSATVAEDSGMTTIDVTTNDDFGGDGPSAGTITLGVGKSFNGNLVSVNDNGTPDDPTDDKIDYTPSADFNGV